MSRYWNSSNTPKSTPVSVRTLLRAGDRRPPQRPRRQRLQVGHGTIEPDTRAVGPKGLPGHWGYLGQGDFCDIFEVAWVPHEQQVLSTNHGWLMTSRTRSDLDGGSCSHSEASSGGEPEEPQHRVCHKRCATAGKAVQTLTEICGMYRYMAPGMWTCAILRCCYGP